MEANQKEEIRQIKRQLLELPARIAELKRRAREHRAAADEIRSRMQDIEAELISQIAVATNGSGKPVYPNETARNAELKRCLAKHLDYQRLKSVLLQTELKRDEAEIEVGELISRFSAWKAIAELTAAELKSLS